MDFNRTTVLTGCLLGFKNFFFWSQINFVEKFLNYKLYKKKQLSTGLYNTHALQYNLHCTIYGVQCILYMYDEFHFSCELESSH